MSEVTPPPSDTHPVPLSPTQHSERENTEGERMKKVLTQIGQKCIELTANPQTVALSAFENLNYRELAAMPQGISIERAVRLPQVDLGFTTFIIVTSGDGIVSVKRNEGKTQAVRSIEATVDVPEDYQEISLDTLRRSELVTDTPQATKAEASLYHRDRLIIGSIPETARIKSIQFTNKERYEHLAKMFAPQLALSDAPLVAFPITGDVSVPPTPDDYEAILRILEQGKISPVDMAKAISWQIQYGLSLTDEEYEQKAARWKEQQNPQVKETDVVESYTQDVQEPQHQIPQQSSKEG